MKERRKTGKGVLQRKHNEVKYHQSTMKLTTSGWSVTLILEKQRPYSHCRSRWSNREYGRRSEDLLKTTNAGYVESIEKQSSTSCQDVKNWQDRNVSSATMIQQFLIDINCPGYCGGTQAEYISIVYIWLIKE